LSICNLGVPPSSEWEQVDIASIRGSNSKEKAMSWAVGRLAIRQPESGSTEASDAFK